MDVHVAAGDEAAALDRIEQELRMARDRMARGRISMMEYARLTAHARELRGHLALASARAEATTRGWRVPPST